MDGGVRNQAAAMLELSSVESNKLGMDQPVEAKTPSPWGGSNKGSQRISEPQADADTRIHAAE